MPSIQTTTILRAAAALLGIGFWFTICPEDHTLCRLSPGLQLTGLCASSRHYLGLDTPTDCSIIGTDFKGEGSQHVFTGPTGSGNLPPWYPALHPQEPEFFLRTGYVTSRPTDLELTSFFEQDHPLGILDHTTSIEPSFAGVVTSNNFDCANSTGGVVPPHRRQIDLWTQFGVGSPINSHSGPTGGGNLPPIRELQFFDLQWTSTGSGVGSPQQSFTGPAGCDNLSRSWTSLQRDLFLQIWIRVGSCHLDFSGPTGSGNLPLIFVFPYFILWRTFIDGGVGSPQIFFTGPIACSDPTFLWIHQHHRFWDSLRIWLGVGSWNLQYSGPTGGGNLPPFDILQLQQQPSYIDSPHARASADRDIHFLQQAIHCDTTVSCIIWQLFEPEVFHCHQTAENPFRKSVLAFCGFGPCSLDQSSWTIGQELNRSHWTSFTLDFFYSWLTAFIQSIFIWQIVLAAVISSGFFVIFVRAFEHLKQRHLFLQATESIHSLSAPFVPISDTGTPGPKSRYKPNRFGFISTGIFHSLCVFLLIYFFSQGFVRGEGCILNMEDAEASTTWQEAFIASCGAKQHVPRPEASRHAPSWHAAQNKVVKRSYKRACKRALALGTTWYRGRCYVPNDFPKSLQHSVTPDFSTQPTQINPTLIKCHRNNQDHRRISVLTWNSGGLSIAKLDEVKAWMKIQNISIAILPETRWTYENEWTDNQWYHIHSGSVTHKGMGILCIISKQLCSQDDIRWLPVITGRLLHIQVRQGCRFLDIIGCYQHTQAHHKQRQTERNHFWTQLDRLLGTLATRHSLILAGDLNCSLPQLQSHSGPQVFCWKGQMYPGSYHADAGQFMSILRMHGLTALNTWDQSCGPTFVQGASCSRIDYLITRMQHADGLAKSTKYAWNAPFCESSGHVPLISTIRKQWFPAAPVSHAKTIGKAQRQLGHRAYKLQTPEWVAFTQDAGMRLNDRLTQVLPSDCTLISDLHEIAIDSFHDHFSRPIQPIHSSNHETVSIVLSKWQLRERLLSMRHCTLSNLFQSWSYLIRLQKLKRASQRHAKQVRKLRFAEILEQAHKAAIRHDTHALFQLINRYSPKQPRRRVQLRNSHGQIATPVEEAALLKRFVSDTWHGPATFPVSPCPDLGLPFTLEQLERALQEIPACKAVARPCSPGFIWKSVAPIIAPTLFAKLLEWRATPQPYIPAWFKMGWMVMLPKPLKPPVHPSALRPIALQEPIGKAVVGLLASRALNEAFVDLAQLPSWAYLPFRSTQDALLRVAQHCRSIRTLVASQRSTPFTRCHALPRHRIAGGISIFLDIERAFDQVDRAKLFAKLASLGVNPKIVQLLSLWHQETSYSLLCNGVEEPIRVGKGLRQGCKAAPFLWCCQIHAFLVELARKTTVHWVHKCVNFYADDGQMGDTFASMDTMQQLLHNLCITFELMEEFGLKINSHKCVALFSITGSSCRQLRNSLLCRHQGTDCLKISAEGHQTFRFPVATQAKYLGAIMSHAKFEDSTTLHRIQLSKIAFGRLRRWLLGSRGLTTRQQLKLWSTCVYPVLSYGLCAIGLTSTGLQRIQQHMYTTIRQILKDHAYLTGHHHFQAFCLQNVDQPVAWLWKTADGLQRSIAHRLTQVAEHDIIHMLDWTQLDHLKTFLMAQTAQTAQHETGPEVPSTLAALEAQPEIPELRCQLCDFVTYDTSQFRRHCATNHGLRLNRCLHIDPTRYSLNGLPQCRYCYQAFTTWRQFIIHAQCGCQVLCAGPVECWADPRRALQPDPALPSTMFAPKLEAPVRGQTLLTDSDLQNVKSQTWGTRVLTIVGSRNWHHMKKEQEACHYLAKRCCICDHFFGRAQELHQHIQTMHPEFWPHHEQGQAPHQFIR